MPAKKGSTATKSKTSGKTASRSTSRSSSKGKHSAPQQPRRREIGAVVCLFLAVFSFLGYFNADGWFIGFFRRFICGLVGKGFFLFPPIFLLCAYILFFHRGRPVRLRLVCALLIPFVLGAMLHMFGCKTEYAWEAAIIKKLYIDGSAAGSACSGGVLGGLLALAFSSMFGKVGSCIVLIVGILFLLLTSFNVTVNGIVEWYKSRERVEYEPEPEPDRRNKRLEKETYPEDKIVHSSKIDDEQVKGGRTGKFNIDIPVDGEENAPSEEKHGSFFNKKPSVPTPDKILRGDKQSGVNSKIDIPIDNQAETPTEAAEVKNDAAEVSEHIPEPVDIMKPLETELAEKKSEKLREEAEKRAVSEEVAGEINESLKNTEAAEYEYPSIDLLAPAASGNSSDGMAEVKMNAERLESTICKFGINVALKGFTRGPSVTRYEVELEPGVKLSKLTNLSDDIALALGATGVRIAPIPNKISIVGIEVPNKIVNVVALREIIESSEFSGKGSKLSFAVGKDIAGNPIVGDIAKMPHMLIAGTTGSGKSVCMNSLILSLLYKSTPEEVRLIMVDPKMVELGIYNEIPHLLIPVVTDPKKAAGALQWAVVEMMKRYKIMSDVGARDLATYNNIIITKEGGEKLPQIVVIIDELADLMMVAGKEVEESICRIGQMGRASGIHLVIATQRPSADVITGLMKANIPSKIAFAVDSALNSRIILDTAGAEKLVGKGDMLYFPLGSGKPLRVQGTFVTDDERENIVNFVKSHSSQQYDASIDAQIEQHAAEKDNKKDSKDNAADSGDIGGEVDEMFNAAVEVILESKQASVSMLQRRLKLGYSRAARLVDQMEERGIVGPFEGSKPRQLLISREQWNEMQGIVPDEFAPVPEEDYFPESDETEDGEE